jgi:hypothetical protein
MWIVTCLQVMLQVLHSFCMVSWIAMVELFSNESGYFLVFSMNVLSYSVIRSKYDFFTYMFQCVCCICCILCRVIMSFCYWILWSFLYDSLRTNWYLISQWLCCSGHVMFKRGRRMFDRGGGRGTCVCVCVWWGVYLGLCYYDGNVLKLDQI